MSEGSAESAVQPVLRLLQLAAGLHGISIDDDSLRRLEWRAVRAVQAGVRLRELDLERVEPAVTFIPGEPPELARNREEGR
jgi:hypothetical protein